MNELWGGQFAELEKGGEERYYPRGGGEKEMLVILI